jgi:hypothetical protein
VSSAFLSLSRSLWVCNGHRDAGTYTGKGQTASERLELDELTAVVEVIQRVDTTAPMTTAPRKRTAVLVLDSAAGSPWPGRSSPCPVAGVGFRPRLAKRNLSCSASIGLGARASSKQGQSARLGAPRSTEERHDDISQRLKEGAGWFYEACVTDLLRCFGSGPSSRSRLAGEEWRRKPSSHSAREIKSLCAWCVCRGKKCALSFHVTVAVDSLSLGC